MTRRRKSPKRNRAGRWFEIVANTVLVLIVLAFGLSIARRFGSEDGTERRVEPTRNVPPPEPPIDPEILRNRPTVDIRNGCGEGGLAEQLMHRLRRAGFDVAGSPFGRLGDRDAEYAGRRKRFAFGDFCDGYVFLRPFGEYEGCTVDPLFITKENLAEAVAYLPNASIKKKILTVSQFLAKMKWDADFKRLYPDLE